MVNNILLFIYIIQSNLDFLDFFHHYIIIGHLLTSLTFWFDFGEFILPLRAIILVNISALLVCFTNLSFQMRIITGLMTCLPLYGGLASLKLIPYSN